MRTATHLAGVLAMAMALLGGSTAAEAQEEAAPGEPIDLGVTDSVEVQGRRTMPRFPRFTYPERALRAGIEGMVLTRILVGEDGRVVRRRSEDCAEFHTATRFERRVNWHPRLCMVGTGPRPLLYQTLITWGEARFLPVPAEDGTPRSYFFTAQVVYTIY